MRPIINIIFPCFRAFDQIGKLIIDFASPCVVLRWSRWRAFASASEQKIDEFPICESRAELSSTDKLCELRFHNKLISCSCLLITARRRGEGGARTENCFPKNPHRPSAALRIRFSARAAAGEAQGREEKQFSGIELIKYLKHPRN